jgi:hypothetical protein
VRPSPNLTAGLLGFPVSLVVGGMEAARRTHRTLQRVATDAPEPEVLVDADTLWRDYVGNPYAADRKYLHREFGVELRPFQIVRLPDGRPTFTYRAFGELRIHALVGESEIEKIAVLVKEIDSAVVIRGTCEGYADGVVRMSGCLIIDSASVIDAA